MDDSRITIEVIEIHPLFSGIIWVNQYLEKSRPQTHFGGRFPIRLSELCGQIHRDLLAIGIDYLARFPRVFLLTGLNYYVFFTRVQSEPDKGFSGSRE